MPRDIFLLSIGNSVNIFAHRNIFPSKSTASTWIRQTDKQAIPK